MENTGKFLVDHVAGFRVDSPEAMVAFLTSYQNMVVHTLILECEQSEKEARQNGFPVSGDEYAERATWLRSKLIDQVEKEAA